MAEWLGYVRQASRLVATYVAGELTSSVKPRPREIAEPTGAATPVAEAVAPEGDRRCPVCAVHDAVSRAKGHVEGIADLGAVPDVIRPTLHLARLDLREARETVAVVRTRVPELGDRCDATAAAIDGAAACLPDPDTVTPQAAAEALPALVAAHHEARDLAIAYYTLERRVHDGDRLRKLYDDARTSNMDADDFYARLKEELGG